jgi:hypothetical protein
MCSTDSGEHSHDHPAPVGNPRAALANWNQPGPLGWKLRRAFVNTAIKIVRRQQCCGRGGEPGC